MAGKLEPITITAYSDKKLQNKVNGVNTFTFPINPEQYTQQYKIELDQSRPGGSSAPAGQYKSTDPEQLQLEFLVDSTGALDEYYKNSELIGLSARKQVEMFMKLAYVVNGDTHKPNYLKVQWGENGFMYAQHSFDCYLSQLDIQYTLFDRTGEPIRAKVKTTFTRYVEQEKEAQTTNRKSPDLTHVRTVQDGDRLPLMTVNLLGDQSYYLKVAMANNLTSFRNLTVGSEIFFPPIEKPTL
jgi:Contractile injection system tube protein